MAVLSQGSLVLSPIVESIQPPTPSGPIECARCLIELPLTKPPRRLGSTLSPAQLARRSTTAAPARSAHLAFEPVDHDAIDLVGLLLLRPVTAVLDRVLLQ